MKSDFRVACPDKKKRFYTDRTFDCDCDHDAGSRNGWWEID